MPNAIFKFDKQLKIGDKGEKLFLKYYGDKASKADGRKYDLFFSGKKVELKTDTYGLDETPNFFMERYGSIEDQKEGGPWRARNDKVDYFVYFYLKDRTFFWFKSKRLADFLDKYVQGKRGKTIANRNYSTLGYTVPREDLTKLVIREDKF